MATDAEARRGVPPAAVRRDKRRHIVTPEGVALPVTLAPRGERAAALLLDLVFIFVPLTLIIILAFMAVGIGDGSNWLLGMVILTSFVVRSFYFIFFELRWHGTTPGKRLVGLRVIDRKGGELRADAVFARNLMREIEVFMPISLLFSTGFLAWSTWSDLMVLAWLLIFVLMPLFNRDSLRAGDMVGGTWVISAPKAALLPDIAERTANGEGTRTPSGSPIEFTPAQLGHYGVYELQTLEQVLRQEGTYADNTRAEVARRIQRKIGWPETRQVDPTAFLEAFYAAQRARLEHRMLLGKRRESKFDEE